MAPGQVCGPTTAGVRSVDVGRPASKRKLALATGDCSFPPLSTARLDTLYVTPLLSCALLSASCQDAVPEALSQVAAPTQPTPFQNAPSVARCTLTSTRATPLRVSDAVPETCPGHPTGP